ncbi:MAG TPA: DUF3566 domain-containing protein [Mycobacteriales bacterium]|nr:DUF3566 domain-containing protein [Mycobacteriales bacterium]
MTSGSGDSRMLGGVPMWGDPSGQGSMPRTSAVMPEAAARPAGDGSVAAAPPRPLTVGTSTAAKGKKGRRARLTVRRIDPWSTLKFSFVYGLAGMIVLLVAVVILYSIVDAMGVIASLRSFLADVSSNPNGGGLAVWLSFSRVMMVAVVVGAINVILFTAFATLTAFIYNVCTDIVGGVEVTLAERN